jgi:hypothetical protein
MFVLRTAGFLLSCPPLSDFGTISSLLIVPVPCYLKNCLHFFLFPAPYPLTKKEGKKMWTPFSKCTQVFFPPGMVSNKMTATSLGSTYVNLFILFLRKRNIRIPTSRYSFYLHASLFLCLNNTICFSVECSISISNYHGRYRRLRNEWASRLVCVVACPSSVP